MIPSRFPQFSQRALAIIAVLFGVVTLFAGSRVLLGADPGYVVFMPLLVYNTAMGLAYVGVGVLAWRNLAAGIKGAGAICLLNLIVLAAIGYLRASGGAVAVESLGAMAFRTAVWFAILIGLWWLGRGTSGAERQGR